MNFRAIFIAIVIATGLIVSAYLVNSKRPRLIVEQPSAAFIRASGKCAECHRNLQYSIVHEFEMSKHAEKGVTCLDCHQVAQGQTGTNHNSFVISTKLTAANCRSCHETIYQQFLHSRHAAAAWAAVARVVPTRRRNGKRVQPVKPDKFTGWQPDRTGSLNWLPLGRGNSASYWCRRNWSAWSSLSGSSKSECVRTDWMKFAR